jgi:chemotaxis signal transduction protein
MSARRQHASSADGIRKFCTFQIADQLYGVDLLTVREINTETGFTRIAHASESIRGYVNIRGQIYLILDLRRMLGFESRTVDPGNRTVLFKDTVGPAFGVLVDRIGDVVETAESEIEPESVADLPKGEEGPDQHPSLLAGACKHGKQLLTILDASRFLEYV